MEFNYPKDVYKHQSHLASGGRPKPSPSKTEQFLKDLGLDDDDTLGDISSPSEDENCDETQPSEIEFHILQKELKSCTEQRDALQEQNQELDKTVRYLRLRLKKEETSKKTRLKILHRAHVDGLKDKQNLINNLQELIEEGGDGGSLRIVSSIEHLHKEKAQLHNDLLKAREEYEEKLNKIEDENIDVSLNATDRQSSLVLEKSAEEKTQLTLELDNVKKFHKEEVSAYEELLKKKEAEIIKATQEKEKRRRSDNSFKLKMEALKNEMESSKRLQIDKERGLLHTVKKLTDEAKRLERERDVVQKHMETLESDMFSRVSDQKALSESTVKLQEENFRLSKDLDRYKMQVDSLQSDASQADQLRMQEEKLQCEIGEMREEILKLERSLDKHRSSSKEKIRFAENETEEVRLQLYQQKRDAELKQEEMRCMMQDKEERMKIEAEEMSESFVKKRKALDVTINKLEKKLSKSDEKVESLVAELSEINSRLSSETSQVSKLQDTLRFVESEKNKLELELVQSRKMLRDVEEEAVKSKMEQSQALVEQDNLKRQLAVVSGESDSAIATMEREAGEMRVKISCLENLLEGEGRKFDALRRRNNDLEVKLTDVEACLSDEVKQHNEALEVTHETHKRDIMKLKASNAIATESIKSKATVLEKAVRLALSALGKLSRDNSLLRKEVEEFPVLLKKAIEEAAKKVADAVSDVNEKNKDLIRRYRKEMELRKKYHNEIVELKGNIRVFVRSRPLISEDGKNAKIALSYDDIDDAVIYVNNSQKGRTQSFDMDKVFSGQSSQEEVYDEVQSLVVSCLDGYHVCIFAYGQTGSGKTYTMEGIPSNPGINQRALADLFRLIDEKKLDWEYEVLMSLVEIYNESLRDLLSSIPSKLEIKMNSDGGFYVQGLKSMQVKNLDGVNKLFKLGHKNRATASTNMNEHSSRSHAVLMISVEGRNKTTGQRTSGKLNLIDLAGSERVSKSGASGDRLKEAQNINRSLSALGDVIHALRNKHGHVPFRNSKLTYMLQGSLSKENKALMLVQVSPIESSISETLCSLNFAQRVRSVELGQASRKTKS